MEKEFREKVPKDRGPLRLVAAALIVLIAATVFSLIHFRNQTNYAYTNQTDEYTTYDGHYVFIGESMQDEVYQGAVARGDETGIYVEWFGENLAVGYSKTDLLRMAIAANVDGILLEADESPQMLQLINEAVAKDIPVVTVYKDSSQSNRQSFVGISGYDLGMEYGRQILKVSNQNKPQKVLIFVSGSADGNSQNIILTGINEVLSQEGTGQKISTEVVPVSEESTFSVAQYIWDSILTAGDIPDIIICLDEQNTVSAYQTVVDYNMVGEIDIIGYYASNTILNAIERNVITSTITVDPVKMGMSAVDALNEYAATGHVNTYITMDVSVITADTVGDYLDNDSNEDAEE